ncbi:presequence protease, partial [Phenoliferia sp. Uapishka_3]
MPPILTNGEARRPTPSHSRSTSFTSPASAPGMTVDAPTPSSSSHSIPSKVGNFNLITSVDLSYSPTQIVKYQSEKTGLKVVWVDVEGPLVQGYFAFITEIFDDSGRPHTLEHAVFMGSEQYPFKGVLDTLANRMFAAGTNAWTDTTNTTYTVGTAGSEGFLGILPVFIDHLLYPTLTEAGFVTEVYHKNGKGEDSGVVYSEMQGRENGNGDLMQLRLQRTLYNKDNALRSETGGLMSALRELSIEQIRAYHASSYLPQNLTLIVAGRSLSPTSLLTTLQSTVEPSIIAHSQAHGPKPPGWIRPFVESSTASNPPKIETDKVEIVEFPEKDESVGEVMVSWIGVPAKEFVRALGVEILSVYLTDGPVSPLYKEFVEIEEPLCTDVSFNSSTEDPSIITAYLSAVPSEGLESIAGKFKTALKRISEEEIDMKRMQSVIERSRLQLLNAIETDAADALMNSILTDALFGAEDGSDLAPQLSEEDYTVVAGWSAKDWQDLINYYYVSQNSITIIGRPSASLADKIAADESARVAATIASLGPEGLAALAKKVEDAQKENDRPIPPEMIRKFSVPDVEKIDWIKVESARSEGVAMEGGRERGVVQEKVDGDKVELPLFVQFDHIQSNFVEISILLFADPTLQSRSLLPLYLDTFFSLPVTRADGTTLGFEEVVAKLDAETLSYSIDINSPLQEGITLKIKVAKENYGVAVAWARDLLLGSHFSVDRIKIATTKAIQNLPSEKRSGSDVAYATYRQIITEPISTGLSMNLLKRAEFLPAFRARLDEEPEAVVAEFEAFRKGLTNPRAMRVSVKGDILSMNGPSATWVSNFEQFPKYEKSELLPVVLSKNVMGPLGKNPAQEVVVFGLSSIESSFSYHVAKGPSEWTHPDQAALTVARSVLNAMEGFLWKFIRGAGLAYGANIQQDLESGLVYYRVYKSPDCFKAFAAAKDLIDSLASGKIEIDELTLESAKSSLAYSVASKESTMNDAASSSFMNQVLLGLPQSHGRIALAKTKDITTADVQRVIKKWIQPIFDPATSIASVATGKAKMDATVASFEELGFNVERRTFETEDDDDEGSESGSENLLDRSLTTTISNSPTFPPELLLKIFSYLRSPTVPDDIPEHELAFDRERNPTLLAAALVCRAWTQCALEEMYTYLEVAWVGRIALSLMKSYKIANTDRYAMTKSLRVQYVNAARWSYDWHNTSEGIRAANESAVAYPDEDEQRRLDFQRKAGKAMAATSDWQWIEKDSTCAKWVARDDLLLWLSLFVELQSFEFRDFDSPAESTSEFPRAQPILSKLDVFKIYRSGVYLNLFKESHVKILDVRTGIHFDTLSERRSSTQLPDVTHLRLSWGSPAVEMVVGGGRRRPEHSLFDMFPPLNLGNLEALELNDITHSDISRLVELIPSLYSIKSLVLNSTQFSDLFYALNEDVVANALSKLPLEHLSISTWPSTFLLRSLPASLRSLALDCVDWTTAPEQFAMDLQDARGWKDQYLSALEVVEILPRQGESSPRTVPILEEMIEDVGRLVKDFELRAAPATGHAQKVLPGRWVFC